MEARIEDGKLVIELSLEKPRPSSTGKTLLVASTRGVQRTGSPVEGKNHFNGCECIHSPRW